MQVLLTEVICDTNFLIHLTSVRIHNIDSLDTQIGDIRFIVPNIVLAELQRLAESNPNALRALKSVSKYPILELGNEKYADGPIIRHIRKNGGMVATMDRKLKRAVKDVGGSIISISNDCVILEA